MMNRPRAGVTLIWIARILMVAFILFLTMFSLDVFSMEGTLLEKLGGFVMHSIPSFILVAVLLVSWRSPVLSGLLALAFAPTFALRWRLRGIAELAMLVLPLVVVGVLFVAAHFVTRKPASEPRP
jgi:thiol:disulfide interchange protein